MTKKFPSDQEIVFLKDKKVKLCIPTEAHLPYFVRWFNNLEVLQFLGDMFPTLQAFEERWLEDLSKDKHNAVFVLHTTEGEPIGTMSLNHINHLNKNASTGAAIGEKKYWGQGYGSAAKMLLLKWAFLELGLRSVRSSVIAFNNRSASYNEKCGYKEVGRLPKWCFRNGEWHDEIIMVVTCENFLKILEDQKEEE